MAKTKPTKTKPTPSKAMVQVKESKKSVEAALTVRKKLSLQKRAGDTIVYVRMKQAMFDVFEEAYAKHCRKNMLNPQSYGMSTFVRENAFTNLRRLNEA